MKKVERIRKCGIRKCEVQKKYAEMTVNGNKYGISAGDRIMIKKQRTAKRGELAIVINTDKSAAIRRVRKIKRGGVYGVVLYIMRDMTEAGACA